MKNLTEEQITVLSAAIQKLGPVASNSDIKDFAACNNISHSYMTQKEFRSGRGYYNLDELYAQVVPITQSVKVKAPKEVKKYDMNMDANGFKENLVPEKDPLYVPFGHAKMIRDVLKSKMFYPLYITGLSGNGKTFGVEQACASVNREVIRINFTVETDEDDLIGGFRLVDGETKFFKGPVIKAMELGAVLLCDEIDLANPAKVMCLQPILEGKGYFIKKTGEYVRPAAGFTVVATANTKGKGSEDGRFIGTNVMNEAFLERFPITIEQEYPSVNVEKKILQNVFSSLDINDSEFVNKLVDWADIIRKTFYDGGVDEIISTRRLVHIAKAYSIFNDRMQSIQMCINRFDDDTKASFSDLYTKIDAGVVIETEVQTETAEEE